MKIIGSRYGLLRQKFQPTWCSGSRNENNKVRTGAYDKSFTRIVGMLVELELVSTKSATRFVNDRPSYVWVLSTNRVSRENIADFFRVKKSSCSMTSQKKAF